MARGGARDLDGPRGCRVLAPAKVNLLLHVLGRRTDGYHELDTLMFPIALHDEVALRVSPARRPSVTCRVTGPEKVPGGAGNLAARAAAAVLERLGARARVAIRLHKVVPHGAGLGGGSSDAAAVIRVLPGLLGRRLPRAEAHAIALSLGADVPFFLDGRAARATGVGECLETLPRVPALTLVVVVVPDRVNTAWAYRHALPRRARAPLPATARARLTSAGGLPRVRAFARRLDRVEAWVFNDFQRGVEAAFGSVRTARRRLVALGAEAAVLSGSGCAMVGLFRSAAAARAAASAYDGPGKVFVARILRSAPRAKREQSGAG